MKGEESKLDRGISRQMGVVEMETGMAIIPEVIVGLEGAPLMALFTQCFQTGNEK